jgi:hypothetical protein
MKARSLEKKFDDGKDITDSLDLSKAKRPLQKAKKGKRRFPHLDDKVSR